MEQFDHWQEFWDKFLLNRHGKAVAETEEDLFKQVARTVNKEPVPKEVFDQIVTEIVADLAFASADTLVDFCCGNGLFTYELRNKVKQIIGIDFSQNIIDTANKYKSAPNITYCLGGVTDYMKDFKTSWPGVQPNKYLMNDSLAYFSQQDLESMLASMAGVSDTFTFLCRGVPNDDLKWNYYNTDERKEFYHALVAQGDLTNYGLGRWWVPAEITAICDKLGLKCIIRNQQLPVSDYRMDMIISR